MGWGGEAQDSRQGGRHHKSPASLRGRDRGATSTDHGSEEEVSVVVLSRPLCGWRGYKPSINIQSDTGETSEIPFGGVGGGGEGGHRIPDSRGEETSEIPFGG